ncbi:EB module, partial [Gryllus bimaculatus]
TAANLREFCRFDKQCILPNTECQNNRCTCKEGRVPYPYVDGLIRCLERGEKKWGDQCNDTLQCGYDNAQCAGAQRRVCDCHPDFPATNNLDKCDIPRVINQSCTFNEQCDMAVLKTECRGGLCACRFGMTPQQTNGAWSCGSVPETPKQVTHIDPAMIGVLVGMALMFIILCVVLRLFSKARWRENRTIFNTPNPRLMNVSLLRDSKLLHSGGERRGSRASVRAPSRQPSMASLRPQSPSQSLGKPDNPQGNESQTELERNRSLILLLEK